MTLAFRLNRLPDEIRAMTWADFTAMLQLIEDARSGEN